MLEEHQEETSKTAHAWSAHTTLKGEIPAYSRAVCMDHGLVVLELWWDSWLSYCNSEGIADPYKYSPCLLNASVTNGGILLID